MNHSSFSPGDASLHYLPPSKQPTANKKATEDAQKAVADALRDDGWTGNGKTTTLSGKKLKAGTHIPNSYTTTTSGVKPSYNTTIVFDPNEYTALFHEAKQEAAQYTAKLPNCTQEQYIAVHLQAIQNAINKHTGATQYEAEENLKKLTDETIAQGKTEIDSEDINTYKAHVCSEKTSIATYYLTEHCPTIDRNIDSTQHYAGGNDGHANICFSYQGKQYAYHPNSPIDGKPNIKTM